MNNRVLEVHEMEQEFEAAFSAFMRYHIRIAAGERKKRLKKGLSHSSIDFLRKVWWVAFKNFDNLYPEYHMVDYKDHDRYIDFVYQKGECLLAIEVDDYQSHCKELTPAGFSSERWRQNHIVLDGIPILRFAYQDVVVLARRCQQSLLQFFGRNLSNRGMTERLNSLTPIQRVIMKFAIRVQRKMTPADVINLVNVNSKTAHKHLKALVDLKLLKPGGSGTRIIKSYVLSERAVHYY